MMGGKQQRKQDNQAYCAHDQEWNTNDHKNDCSQDFDDGKKRIAKFTNVASALGICRMRAVIPKVLFHILHLLLDGFGNVVDVYLFALHLQALCGAGGFWYHNPQNNVDEHTASTQEEDQYKKDS